MTQFTDLLTLSPIAAVNLTACRFVSPTGGLPSAGGNTLGVAKSTTTAGQPCPTTVLGTSMVEVSAAVAKGAAMEALADGRGKTLDTGVPVSRALQAATAAGQKIEVLLIPN